MCMSIWKNLASKNWWNQQGWDMRVLYGVLRSSYTYRFHLHSHIFAHLTLCIPVHLSKTIGTKRKSLWVTYISKPSSFPCWVQSTSIHYTVTTPCFQIQRPFKRKLQMIKKRVHSYRFDEYGIFFFRLASLYMEIVTIICNFQNRRWQVLHVCSWWFFLPKVVTILH